MTEAAAVVGLLVVHNLVTNLWFPAWSYVPVNLAAALVLVAVAGPVPWGGSWAVGGAAVLVVAGTAVLVVAGTVFGLAGWPRARPLLADRRMAGVGGWGTAYRALVRIPLGTVVLEEVAFRGVLPALVSPVGAAALFGLWHVLPTAKTLDTNGVVRGRSVAVAGAVGATAVAGLVLGELARVTGGLLVPMLVHAAANGAATVAAFAVLRAAASPGLGPASRYHSRWS